MSEVIDVAGRAWHEYDDIPLAGVSDLILSSRRLQRGAPPWSAPPVLTGAGDRLDSDDPDGGAVPERSRRRHHID